MRMPPICAQKGCRAHLTRQNDIGYCAEHKPANRAVSDACRKALATARDARHKVALECLNGLGRACYDRCIAAGMERHQAMSLAREEMAAYWARVAAQRAAQ